MGTRPELAAIALFVFALPIPASANSVVPIDMVPAEYTPINGPQVAEPVSLSSFHFEVNPKTRRARVIVEYTYPDAMIYLRRDPTRGPRSSVVQLPGLSYDAMDHQVIYESNGTRTVCATVDERDGLFGRHEKVTNTGACTVTARLEMHAEDDGWSIHQFRALGTYFSARSTVIKPLSSTR